MFGARQQGVDTPINSGGASVSRPRQDFRDRLLQFKPVLLDGATGTELTRRGVDTGLPLWSARALLEAPEVVRRIHADYVCAGAEVITANTFRTHGRSLARGGLAERAAELSRFAVTLAREAVERASLQRVPGGRAYERSPATAGNQVVFVAGSMAPLEDCYEPALVPADAMLAREHEEMAGHLQDARVDLILVETMNCVREAAAAARAALATRLPTWVGLVCDRRGRLLSGESLQAAAAALEPLGPDGLMINCTDASRLHVSLGELARHTELPLAAYGNVGHADDDQGWVNTDAVDPHTYAGYAARWIEIGARLIGGCCGTTPAHIHALRSLQDQHDCT